MSNVTALFQPNAQRIADVRRWFVDQAVADEHVCALSISITADSQIHTRGVGIEPEQAAILIGELRSVIERMESQLPEDYMTRYATADNGLAARANKACNVVALRPAGGLED